MVMLVLGKHDMFYLAKIGKTYVKWHKRG